MDFLSIYDINISGFTGFHDCFFTLSFYVFEMIAFPSVFFERNELDTDSRHLHHLS